MVLKASEYPDRVNARGPICDSKPGRLLLEAFSSSARSYVVLFFGEELIS